MNLFSKTKFQTGFIINTQGDTVSGYLQELNSIKASKYCLFKKSSDTIVVKYLPSDINGYRFTNGKYYISKIIKQDSINSVSVFMEYLIDGIADIFYYRDNHGDHYYIHKEPDELLELNDDKLTVKGEYAAPERYKGKLRYFMQDGEDIEDLINKTILNHKSLINLSKNYHERVCDSETCVVFEKSIIEFETSVDFILGSFVNSYMFGNELKTNIGQGIQMGVGINLENIFDDYNKYNLNIKFLLERDFNYIVKATERCEFNNYVTYNGTQYIFNKDESIRAISELAVNLNVLSLKLPIVVNYNYRFNEKLLYFGGGMSNKFIFNYNKGYIVRDFENQYGKTFNSYLVGAIANIGFEKTVLNSSRVGINLSAETLFDPNALNMYLRLSTNQFNLQLYYRF